VHYDTSKQARAEKSRDRAPGGDGIPDRKGMRDASSVSLSVPQGT
jgi:hypothetical protein